MKIKNKILGLLCLLLVTVAQAGSIKVKYSTTAGSSWQQNEIDAFERAAKHWADVLDSPHEIRVHAFYRDLIAANGNDSSYLNVLGYASANSLHTITGGGSNPKIIANTYYVSALTEYLVNQPISGLDYHITINMNKIQGIDWYFGATFSGIGSREYDFTTVVLHELAHGLGFVSSAVYDTLLKAPKYNASIPYSMDRFIYKNLGAVDLTSLPASGSSTTAFLTSNSLFFKGAKASAQNGGNRPKLYAPSP